MTKIKLLTLVITLFGPCVYVSTRRGCRPERHLAATLCAQSLALVFLGYVLPFSVSMAVLAGVSAVLWGAALIRTWRTDKQFIRLLASPALVFAACVFLYEVCARRVFLSYDEYSHWGILPKVIALFGELPRAGFGAAYIQFTYPPAAAMLPAAAMSLLDCRDGIAYLGYALLLGGLMWSLAWRAGNGKWKTSLAAMALLYLSIMAVFPLSILRMFVEPLIALLMGHLIIGAWEERDGGALEDCLYAVMLAMTKNTGPVFVLLALMIRLFVKPSRGEAMAALRMLLVSLAGFASYQVYCRVQGIQAAISPSHFSENIRALLSGTLDANYTSLPARFAQFFFGQSLPDSGVYSSYGFGTCAAVMGLLLALSAAHVLSSADRRRALRLWSGVWLANALYTAMIVASYFFSFTPAEVERLAEADRYTMLVALWTAVLLCAALLWEQGGRNKKRRLALAGACFAVMLPLSHMEMTVKTFITREYVEHTIWAQDHSSRMTAFLKDNIGEDERGPVLCMGEYNYVQLHHMLAGMLDIGKIDKSWGDAPWSGSCEAVREELANGSYAYVFVGGGYEEDGDLAIDGRYAPLAAGEEGLEPYSLYRVQRTGENDVDLVHMASMTESET